MQKLINDIKESNFKNIYLLYGPEDYLRKQYRDRLAKAMSDPEDTMNYHYFEGKDTSPEKLIDLAETMPFLAERRMIVVENSGFFKNSCEKLAEYLKSVPETTTFLFVETEVDKRSKMFKACKDYGYAAVFEAQNEETLRKWILGILRRENKQVTQRALELFLEFTGTDMEIISSELEKLICYTMDKPDITGEDVETITTRQISNRIFDMIEAVALKKQRMALDLYYDLITLKEPPMRILFLITRHFNLLYQTKLMRQKGYDEKGIGAKISLSPYIARKYIAQSSRFPLAALRATLELCAQTDEDVKSGKILDVLAVELLLVGLSQS